uniref:Uncharacterized protein n=1 Tax=Anguilla anguilla TaxID=7936 RepID=A0A0E9QQC7_ANGAN
MSAESDLRVEIAKI